MHVTTKPINPYTIEARITLEQQELEGYLRQTKEAMTREVTVEGFRKGKAPQHRAESQIGEAAIRAEALELALGESFTQAAQEQAWDIARTTDLKVERNDKDGLAYTIHVHVWPTVVLPDLAEVKVSRKTVEVSDKEVDDALDTVRGLRATFLDKTGAAALDDRVEVDFDASMDGEPIEGGSSRNHPLVIGGKAFMPGFEEELIGLTAGMAKEFSLTAPADYYEPRLAGKKVDFKVTLQRVQVVLKPAADDAFAKSLGKFEGLAQLRESLRQGIVSDKQTREQQRVRLAILDAVIAKADVPTPEDLIIAETDEMTHRFSHDLRERGIEMPMYLARLKKTEEQLKADWRPEAERQVRIMLVLRQLAKEKDLHVANDELNAAVNEAVGQLIKEGQATEEQIDAERVRTVLAERILREKVLRLIEDTCAA